MAPGSTIDSRDKGLSRGENPPRTPGKCGRVIGGVQLRRAAGRWVECISLCVSGGGVSTWEKGRRSPFPCCVFRYRGRGEG